MGRIHIKIREKKFPSEWIVGNFRTRSYRSYTVDGTERGRKQRRTCTYILSSSAVVKLRTVHPGLSIRIEIPLAVWSWHNRMPIV